jgi:branched-chain amino acid transport system permease protein
MTEALQFLISGLVIGSIYGLSGIAFTGIYNVTGVVNFAQGDKAMIGAMLTISLLAIGMSLPLAAATAILATGVVGALIERVTMGPIGGHVWRGIIVTIGVGIVLRGIAVVVWGTEARGLPAFSGTKPIEFFGATITPQSLWVLGITLLLTIALALFFQFTFIGKAFRACAVNPFAARLAGIEVRTMSMIAFVISGVLGAIAGIIVTPITLMQYDAGLALGLKGFVACIIGGFGNPVGAMFGGLILGVTESFSAGYLSSGYKNAIAFVVLLAFLIFRPEGIFGEIDSRLNPQER